jgi:hypothetical protein
LLVGAIAGIGLRWSVQRFFGPAPPHQVRFWILVTNDASTGDTQLDKSLRNAFHVGLEQFPYADVVPPSLVGAFLRRMERSPDLKIDEALGREMCRREHIRWLLPWSIAQTGPIWAVSARLVDPKTGASVRSFQATAANTDGIPDAVSTLIERMRLEFSRTAVLYSGLALL